MGSLSLVDAVLLRRAEEQIAVSFLPRACRADGGEVIHLCHVPGCQRPTRKAARGHTLTCPECFKAGFTAAPCRLCGGPLRRIDQRHRGERQGICPKCRAEMPQKQSGWVKGQSGNPTGKAKARVIGEAA